MNNGILLILIIFINFNYLKGQEPKISNLSVTFFGNDSIGVKDSILFKFKTSSTDMSIQIRLYDYENNDTASFFHNITIMPPEERYNKNITDTCICDYDKNNKMLKIFTGCHFNYNIKTMMWEIRVQNKLNIENYSELGAIMFDRDKMRYSNVIRKKCKFR